MVNLSPNHHHHQQIGGESWQHEALFKKWDCGALSLPPTSLYPLPPHHHLLLPLPALLLPPPPPADAGLLLLLLRFHRVELYPRSMSHVALIADWLTGLATVWPDWAVWIPRYTLLAAAAIGCLARGACLLYVCMYVHTFLSLALSSLCAGGLDGYREILGVMAQPTQPARPAAGDA